MSKKEHLTPSLENPFALKAELEFTVPGQIDYEPGLYEAALQAGHDLQQRPLKAAGIKAVQKQHEKKRMTIWERIQVLADAGTEPKVLYQNWGKNLDGASLVTAIVKVNGRDVAMYGHDFTVRAGSMDATNGTKLANLFQLAGKLGIPLVGMNDSAGAYIPAGVGGLDGYAEAFTALRKINGVVPSIMCMFGYNAGGGAYLPRQGSFVIQPNDTFFGLTGPGVVKSVLGEDVTADELGGPSVHSQSGVTDFVVPDEVAALRKVKELLNYLPDNSASKPPFQPTSDPLTRRTWDVDLLLKKAFNSPTGFNTPFDISIIIQQMCDHGDYFEIQPERARNTICALGRIGGNVVGFVANNSAVSSGQIDIDAAYKNARFIRFCNIYNIPVIFMEDTTGFLPGRDQETGGIVQAGRAMLDAIIDLRTPRFLVIVRNAFGGAYASFNNYPTGADFVCALPTTRLAVMGPAGVEYVYKDEVRKIRGSIKSRIAEATQQNIAAGMSEADASAAAQTAVAEWQKQEEALLTQRYERELMNPNEALSLGSISQIVMPSDLRKVLGEQLELHLKGYQPAPMSGVQREFH
ncbi:MULTISPECIES: acyl-CoA carboxylase subunit beta [Spongiibacter]|uniref:acyl-CoA carboxylase subunit beta n=3 Tax=Spongiibacteraceae TaxID=1706375 RepID=UPI0003B4A659|nr:MULTISPECIES: carboxyl transferase domain-containing protein [Spongiibacter]MAY39315.1 acetyl-CoA carboxylase carboxyltransferase subunit [Spongiibacter sp.]MBI58975.1 acetyl-CoA carboxylase carboxyltransferase subunit [Spongiibacter sp.]MBO6753971.1 acetyl-CoA carboxylase carboxyltransferase subunit [Spongiibacter sp.]MBU72550.1 acetyl-CoA carboxylase carboxyltransferase subunit [Spongiibacter sp.]|tara:strand:- start:8613 stop:10346 length:1734 start_codon:yes stop_codon:yes gene_type:complete